LYLVVIFCISGGLTDGQERSFMIAYEQRRGRQAGSRPCCQWAVFPGIIRHFPFVSRRILCILNDLSTLQMGSERSFMIAYEQRRSRQAGIKGTRQSCHVSVFLATSHFEISVWTIFGSFNRQFCASVVMTARAVITARCEPQFTACREKIPIAFVDLRAISQSTPRIR